MYESIYMTCPEQANQQRLKVDWCLPGPWGAWGRGEKNECYWVRDIFWNDVLKLTVVKTAQVYEYPKNH